MSAVPYFASAIFARLFAVVIGFVIYGLIASFCLNSSLKILKAVGLYSLTIMLLILLNSFGVHTDLQENDSFAFEERTVYRCETIFVPVIFGSEICYHKPAIYSPDSSEYHFSKGRSHMREKKYKQAISDFSEAISIDSRSYDSYWYRGISYEIIGDKKNAVKDIYDFTVLSKRYGQWEKYDKGIIKYRNLKNNSNR